MSSLALSVLLLAAIAIAVVVGYNLWLTRRFRSARAPEAARRDPSPSVERGEPSLGLDLEERSAVRDAETDFETGTHADAVAPTVAREAASPLDPRTDCIIELALPGRVAAERLMAFGNRLRRVGSKPVTLEVCDETNLPSTRDVPFDLDAADENPVIDNASADHWASPVPGLHYRRVRLGVLLVNRGGPLNAMEFSEFIVGVQSIADALGAIPDLPDMTEVLADARALDELCEPLDAQVDLGVQAGEALGIQELAMLALEAGCVERGNNRYVRLGDNGEMLFSLALADAPDRLSLLLDVPRAPASLAPWAEMLACARLCAERLGGRLVDDAGRPLGEAHLAAIGQQIDQRHQALEAAGFPAGSAPSLRLFN